METPPGHEVPSTDIKASEHWRPDAKTQRYDRQLRLWAASGQAALESAHVLVVSASAIATSTLKNLVLPGVGAFTILDDGLVSEADLGNNFFLQPDETRIGDCRAEQAAKYLSELNDGVKANWLSQSVSTFLESSADPLAPYSLVICIGARPTETLPLSDRCWDAGVPMIAVRNSGFIASVRTQMVEAHFVETHPEQEATLDLRLDVPWPALEEYALSEDLSRLESHDYAHVPPVVILLQALHAFKQSNGGRLPSKYAEKIALKKSIAHMKRGGVNADEENFQEAIDMVMKTVKPTTIPSSIQSLFQDPACEQVSSKSPPFWLMLRALRDFVTSSSTNGGAQLLPLTGHLPDMKATSSGYASLLSIYRDKAKKDIADMQNYLNATLKSGGIPNDGTVVTEEMLLVFIKNSAFLEVVRCRKMRDEYERPVTSTILQAFEEAAQPDPFAEVNEDEDAEVPLPCTPLHFYLALRAADIFNVEYSRWPGSGNEDEDANGQKDVDECLACAERVMQTCTGNEDAVVDAALDRAVKEIVRGGGSALPQMAALIGGVVAQEAIKILTKQYVPLNGTWLFDGMKSTSKRFNF